MKELRVLLCCGAGMSSGFLASSARKAVKKQKENMTVEARSKSEVAEYLTDIDVLLLGPHYAAELDNYKDMTASYNVKVDVIPKDIYSHLDGSRLIDFAKEVAEKNINEEDNDK